MRSIRNIYGPVFAILFAVFILILSIIPTDISGEPPSFYFPGMDKFIHAGMYGVLTFLVLSVYYKKNRLNYIVSLYWMLAILSYSVLMELIQYFLVEYRSGDLKDVVANLAGILLAFVFLLVYKRVRS